MGIAIVIVSPELLREALALPDDTTVIDAKANHDAYGGIMLKIDSGSLPDLQEGEVLPIKTPTITEERHECGHSTKTWSWYPPAPLS